MGTIVYRNTFRAHSAWSACRRYTCPSQQSLHSSSCLPPRPSKPRPFPLSPPTFLPADVTPLQPVSTAAITVQSSSARLPTSCRSLRRRYKRNAVRTAQLLLVPHPLPHHTRHTVVLHAESAVARLRDHAPMQWPWLLHQRRVPVRFRLCDLLRTQRQRLQHLDRR